MPQQLMFVFNLSLLMGLLLVGAIAIILVILIWAGLRIGWWHWGYRRQGEQDRRHALRADGSRYPPMGRGQCQSCGAISPQIHYPPSGEKLCRACYDARYPVWRPPQA